VLGIVISSTLLIPRLLPRIGPRPMIVTGQLFGAAGLLWLSRLEVGSSYAGHVMPALFVMGLGMGSIFGSCFNTATAGTKPSDAGVASALVNTGQQAGGSLGTALLNTLAASAATSYVTSHGPVSASVAAEAAVHGYATAYYWGAGFFAFGAVLGALLFRRRGSVDSNAVPAGAPSAPAPVPAS
jgi:MFS family permease